ncbi:hypothetical protein GTW43_02820 [Streptomyces sp. SID5785]|uniref:hypothetical protein n=1 Tax=Streptomyces sp. SID5785 TaxID=2690309 RepID=UPI00136153B8|nr:hypothetical protein [Streptomyces sp. SID5785]MZD04018.1 hypothetical protein [Streptomyces sp. SID5785]
MFRPMRRAAFFDLTRPPRPAAEDLALDQALARHRAEGDLVVLVMDAHQRLPRPPVAEETLIRLSPSGTGDLDKCAAVIEAMARLCIDPASCFGYGDWCVGTGLLSVVGNPRVLTCSACPTDSLELAQKRGWPVVRSPSAV